MNEDDLIARLDAELQHWVDLPGGLRVQFRRPLETEFHKFRHGVTVDHLCEYVTGWAGFTEATLLGAGIGASDVLPFGAKLWARVVRDRVEYVAPVAQAIATAITAYLGAKDAATKN